MGTRSLVHFFEGDADDEVIIATVYRQMDGYYSCRGVQLAEFLSKITMRNGYGMDDAAGTHANGMGCLAAQWIAEEKDGQIGSVYLQAPGLAASDDVFIEYEYEVRDVGGELTLVTRGHEGYDLPFSGRPRDFDIETLKGPENEDG